MAPKVIYRPDQQLVNAAFFDSDGPNAKELFRGKVAKEYAQDRASGLRWVELRDAYEAEQAAKKAEAEAAAASTTAAPDPLALIGDLETQLAEARGALQALQQSQADLKIATPEMVLSNAGQIHRVAGLAADIEAQSLAHQQQADQLMQQVAAKQAELETLIGNLASTAGALQADTREAVTAFVADGQRRLADSISKRITGFELQAAQLRGPKGNTGAPGMSVATVPTDPRKMDAEALEQRFRRPVIPGDQAEQQTPDGLLRWTWSGEVWEQSSIVPAKVVVESRPLSIFDASTHTSVAQTIVRAGSGGSSGGESLLVNRIALNAPVGIGDTSNHGGEDIRSGEFELELRALDGSLAGRTLSLITAFNYDGGTAGPSFTEYALEGSLKGVFEIDLSMYLAAAGVPTGFTTTLPSGAQALRTTATVRPIPGATGTGGVTRFALRGSVEYNTLATGRAYGPNESMPQLLWHWG